MDVDEIKSRPSITLKANPYLKDVNAPRLYQRRGILMMLKRMRMILGDDVGLGKTLQAIAHYTYIKHLKPGTKAVVFTEKGALKQWESEFEKWTTGIKVKRITAETHPDKVMRSMALKRLSVDVVITTYSTLYKYRQYLVEGLGKGYVVYADEPNYFKNMATQLHGAVMDVTIPASRVYGLTATVIENRLEESLCILKAISPGTFMSVETFYKKFAITKRVRTRLQVIGYKNMDQYKAYIDPYYYGRTQDDPEVEQDLPEVVIKDVEIEMSDEQSELVVQAETKLLEKDDGSIERLTDLTAMIRMQQLVNSPSLLGYDEDGVKEDVLIEMLTNSLAGQKVLIASKYRSQVDVLERLITKKLKKAPVRITGKETEEQRARAREQFMTDGSMGADIILITRPGQKALNLQKGGFLFFYDLPWNYGLYKQTTGRIKRTGSEFKRVGVFRMLALLSPRVADRVGSNQTIDHYTLNVLMKKKVYSELMSTEKVEIESDQSTVLEIVNELRRARKK